jgi:16S rRNA (cytidine1402-2'-O)-methyltransferase
MVAWAARSPHTVVLYESPQRLADTLAELAEVAGAEREVVVARELTKRFEEFRRGTLGALAAYYSDTPPRGELVIVLSAAPPAAAPTPTELRELVAALRAAGETSRTITETLMTRFGVSRNEAYQLAHAP